MTQTKANTRHQANSKKTVQKSDIESLLDAVRVAVAAFNALKSIGAHFDDREQTGMRNLVRFARQHALAIKSGTKPEVVAIVKTIRLAQNVGYALDDRFEAIMRDSFVLFDKGMAAIRKVAPEILVRDGDKIIALQEALRAQLAIEDAPYDDVIDAYKAMMNYLPSVSQEAEEAVEAERKRRRNERNVATSEAILAELDGLELDV